tara:strand:+ start:61 stop:321 length:261 start_codon:yes stop_codon:yes gene_type:complete
MDINNLIAIVKKKLTSEFVIDKIDIEDKSFSHRNHPGHQEGKFHLRLKIESNQLKNFTRIESNKKIYKVLDKEIREFIHSLQIFIR